MSIFILLIQPSDERPDDLVDAHYVAARFGCSPRTVRAGGANTGGIPRVSRDPLRFRRADVDQELQRRIEASRPKKAQANSKPIRLIDRTGERRRSRSS